jgi:hypothetical protein
MSARALAALLTRPAANPRPRGIAIVNDAETADRAFAALAGAAA